ncbi:ATP synthase subunit s, mitochondrial [Anthonomus grandis grandis]|uniref:ATP synthase subunit s, mitochondrial n=1 Tax=Anthonomus grandis grandis TaxID=2921223 RepID=UPI002166445B|nr:ATP synthase subunit s, mitochondrial [Anthonomus grandis grandis]
MSVYTILNLATKPCKNHIHNVSKRSLFHWINKQFNALDEDRKKLVGPDRVCAEWILRNGGKVKFVDAFESETDYNNLPKEEVQVKLQEIDATGSSIMANGFEHLKGCNHISKIILDQCSYLENEALEGLSYVKDSLLFLQVSRCGNITEQGLVHLLKLVKLRTLIIFGLPYLKDRKKMLDVLGKGLKTCQITFEE